MISRIFCVIFLTYAFGPGNLLHAQKKAFPYYPKKAPPSYHEEDEAYAMRIDSSIVIDGHYDLIWDRIHIHPIQRRISGNSGRAWSDFQGGFQLAWNGEYLFLHVMVVDEVPLLGQGDSIRVAFGPIKEGPSHVFEVFPTDIKHIKGVLQGLIYDIGPPPPSGHPEWAPEPGYTVELAIPLQELGINHPEEADWGVNLWISDSDDGNARESHWEWTGGLMQPDAMQLPLGRIQFKTAYYAGSESGFMPEQIWMEEEGIVIIEPEAIERHSNWQLKSSPVGFTGSGYLYWQGDDWTVPPEPWVRRSNNDYSNERQPPQEEWLILRILIETPGTYMLDVRNIHKHFDGDNDNWFGRVGEPFHPGHPISRVGDNLKDGTGFTWLDWGVRELTLDKGLHNFFLGGRSIGFGVDRVALYLKDNELAKTKALDPVTRPSTLWDGAWQSLMPEGDLRLWDVYLGPSRETLKQLGKSIKERIEPDHHIGLNPEGQKEFSIVFENNEPVLKIKGETYGALTTHAEYENYHLSMYYKWGEKKWPPRLDEPRDSGVLFHSFGPFGDRTNSWMKALEFQVQEHDTGDFWKMGTSMMDAPAVLDPTSQVFSYKSGAPMVTFGPDNSRCMRTMNHESPFGEWTRIDLYTYEQTAIFVVNGHPVNLLQNTRQKVSDGQEIPLVKGKIQLQSEAAEIYYKDIKIRPILEIPEAFIQELR